MAGTWVRAGTISLTSGSKKVTGTGTAWNSGLNKITKGCALKHNNIDYEVDYVNSDTELYLVDTYNGATLSGQAYRIQVAVTDTIPELSSRIAQALAYWNGQGANLQLMMSGSGNVTLTFPDGTQVTIPAWGNLQPKDGLLTAIAALTTSADKLFYATGADAVAMTTLSAKGRELIDDADSSAMLTTLGVSTFIKSLLDDTDAAAALGTLRITKASLAETNSRLATDRVVTPAGLNAVVPYAPSVNPTLDLDFAKQKYRWNAGAAGLTESSTPSLMTFTRASTATYFDAMGVMRQAANDIPRIDYDPLTGECKGLLVEEQRTNLVTYSIQFALAKWTKTGVSALANTIISPAGDLTGGTVSVSTAAQSNISTTVTMVAGVVYTTSIYVKAGNTNVITIRLVRGPTFLAETTITLGTSAEAVHVGNGWYRCTIISTVSSDGTNGGLLVYPGGRRTQSVGDYVYFWGAQLEAGAFPTSYIPTPATFTGRASTAGYLDANGVVQKAASGVARSNAYDYDSAGVLQPIGLLLEASATNQLLYSEQFDNVAWNKSCYGVASAPSVTANYAASPDGTTTADRIVFALNGGTTLDDHTLLAQGQTTVASTTYTQSIWLKTTDGSTKTVHLSFAGENSKLITVTGTWQRFSNTGTASDTYRGFRLALRGASGTADSADLLIWGAQLEVGAFPTSYIPTTSAQVTRAADTSTSAQVTRTADNAVISGANFSQWYKQSEGSVTCDFDVNALGGTRLPGLFSFYTDVSNRIGAFVDDSNTDGSQFCVKKGSVTPISQINCGAIQEKTKQKVATSFSNEAVSLFDQNGVAGTTYISGAGVPLSVSQLKIGVFDDTLNGHIRSLKYYPKALTSTELQAMTA